MTLDSHRRRSPDVLVLACLGATWIIWGSTYLAIKFALGGFPTFYMMGTRFLVAGSMLLAYQRLRGASMPTARQWFNAAVIGALMLGFGMGCTAHAEETVDSGLVVAFIAVTPLLTVLARLPFGIRPGRGEVIGILVGLCGVMMLTQGDGFQASPSSLVVMALACSGWTLGSVLSQQVLPLASGATGFASQMLCGGAVLIGVSAARGEQAVLTATPLAWASWVYLVVFGSLIAFNAYMYLLGRVSSGLATSYTYVNPVIAMLLGIALAGEHISAWEWASAGVILAGVVILVASRR